MDTLSTHLSVEHFDDARLALFFLVSYTTVTAQPFLNMNVYAFSVVLIVFLVVETGLLPPFPVFQPFCQSDTHLLLPLTNVAHT
jgi:hypothetical protein